MMVVGDAVASVDWGAVTELSGFQRRLFDAMVPCQWYLLYPGGEYDLLPLRAVARAVVPVHMVAKMVVSGALRTREHVLEGAFSVPLVMRPCCDRCGDYDGFGSGRRLFRCPHSCCCHD